MGQDYIPLKAETENGELICEPSEGVIFGLIVELAAPDNTFVIIEPDEDDPAWFASVSLLDDGRYEVEFRDPTHRDHQLNTHTDPDKAANAVAHWAFHVSRIHARLRRPKQ
jgi:hypothetical protein